MFMIPYSSPKTPTPETSHQKPSVSKFHSPLSPDEQDLVASARPNLTMPKRKQQFESPVAKRQKTTSMSDLIHPASDVWNHLIAPFMGLEAVGVLANTSKEFETVSWDYTQKQLMKTRFRTRASMSGFHEPALFEVIKATPKFVWLRKLDVDRTFVNYFEYSKGNEPYYVDFKAIGNPDYKLAHILPWQVRNLSKEKYRISNPRSNPQNPVWKKKWGRFKEHVGRRQGKAYNWVTQPLFVIQTKLKYNSWGGHYTPKPEKVDLDMFLEGSPDEPAVYGSAWVLPNKPADQNRYLHQRGEYEWTEDLAIPHEY